MSGALLTHVEAYAGEASTKANDQIAVKQRCALVAITALGSIAVAAFPPENELRLQALFEHPSQEVRDAAASRLASHMAMPETVTRGDGFEQSLAIALQQLARRLPSLLHAAATITQVEVWEMDGLLILPPVAFHSSSIPQAWRDCLGPFWSSIAPADDAQQATLAKARDAGFAAAGRAQERALAYEAREVRFVGGASHMCGGTVDVEAVEAAAAASVSRSLARAAAYEMAEVCFVGVDGTHHLDGGTIDAPAQEQARSAAVTRALEYAAVYEGADASGVDGMVDWSKASAEKLEKLLRDSKAGIAISKEE
mmetsp:Transcript_69481/g.208552  ORF Transcript_69481/g.208552 Transcript_69481/m.208552 type:complete len:311 (-) Transcript_69481:141-1073(-)